MTTTQKSLLITAITALLITGCAFNKTTTVPDEPAVGVTLEEADVPEEKVEAAKTTVNVEDVWKANHPDRVEKEEDEATEETAPEPEENTESDEIEDETDNDTSESVEDEEPQENTELEAENEDVTVSKPDEPEETVTEPEEVGEETFNFDNYNFVTAYVYNTNLVNVRSGPGTNYSKVGTLEYGTEISAAYYSDGWCVVNNDGTPVYICSQYLTKTKPEEKTAQAATPANTTATPANTTATPTQSVPDATTVNASYASIVATAQSVESDSQKQLDALCAQLEANGFTLSGLSNDQARAVVNRYNANYSLLNTNSREWSIGGYDNNVTVSLNISPDASREAMSNLIVNTYGVSSASTKLQIVRDTCARVRAKMSFSYGYTDTQMTTSIANRQGVCLHYARIAYVLLNAEGIPTRMVGGYGPTGSQHEWNQVYIDGTWYTVDFCIFANSSISPDGFVSSGYVSSYRECYLLNW